MSIIHIVPLNLHTLPIQVVLLKELMYMKQEKKWVITWQENIRVYDADVVIPVPDSARPAALGYAAEL